MGVGVVVAWLVGFAGTADCQDVFFPPGSMRIEKTAGGRARPDRTQEYWDGAAKFSRCQLAEELGLLGEASMFRGEADSDFRVLVEGADGSLLVVRARGREVAVKRHEPGRGTSVKESRAVLQEASARALSTLVSALRLADTPGLRPSKAFGPGIVPVHPVSWLAEVRESGAYGYGWFEDPVAATNGGAELIRAVRLIVSAAGPELLPKISGEQVTTHPDGG
jgi:hypothetical protein